MIEILLAILFIMILLLAANVRIVPQASAYVIRYHMERRAAFQDSFS